MYYLKEKKREREGEKHASANPTIGKRNQKC